MLYLGVTSDLIRRIWQHKEGFVAGFTKKYEAKNLAWYEIHTEIISAINREKQIKAWRRDWKVKLIQSTKPTWQDLFATLSA